MKNVVKISTDGICLYVISKIIAHKIGLTFLIVLNILFGVLAFYVFAQAEDNSNNVKAKVCMFLIGIPIYIFTLGRYTAWNLWGEERVIINTKSISYQYSYGIVEPKMTTIPFRNLSLGINILDSTTNEEKGQFILYDYEENNLPFEIFTSSGLISKPELIKISEEIEMLFNNEKYRGNNFIPYSIN